MSRVTDDHDGVRRFVAAGQKLCSLIPCFSLLWSKVSSIKHAKVGTACINHRFEIKVDGDWALKLPEKTLLFVAAHEVFHPILIHTELFLKHITQDGTMYPLQDPKAYGY